VRKERGERRPFNPVITKEKGFHFAETKHKKETPLCLPIGIEGPLPGNFLFHVKKKEEKGELYLKLPLGGKVGLGKRSIPISESVRAG